jgi:hypothetical protein
LENKNQDLFILPNQDALAKIRFAKKHVAHSYNKINGKHIVCKFYGHE